MIENIPPLMVDQVAAPGPLERAFIRHEADLAKQFQIGQMLQLRVLHKIGPQRFAILLGGSERVMESNSPLRPGDVLHGRIAELGDQIVVERSRIDRPADSQTAKTSPTNISLLMGEAMQGRLALQRPLSRSERQAIETAAKKTKSAELSHGVGLALRNLDIDISNVDIAEAVGLLKSYSQLEAIEAIPGIEGGETQQPGSEEAPHELLGNMLAALFEADKEKLVSHPSEMMDGELFARLLNAADASCIRHRFGTAHVLSKNSIAPVDVALFEQDSQNNKAVDAVNSYRAGSISLATKVLGRVDIQFLLRDKQLSLLLSGERSETVLGLENSAEELRADFAADGLELSSLRYAFSEGDSAHPAFKVLEHLANLDRYEVRA